MCLRVVGGTPSIADCTGAQNEVAMQLIVHHVKDQLKKVRGQGAGGGGGRGEGAGGQDLHII